MSHYLAEVSVTFVCKITLGTVVVITDRRASSRRQHNRQSIALRSASQSGRVYIDIGVARDTDATMWCVNCVVPRLAIARLARVERDRHNRTAVMRAHPVEITIHKLVMQRAPVRKHESFIGALR